MRRNRRGLTSPATPRWLRPPARERMQRVGSVVCCAAPPEVCEGTRGRRCCTPCTPARGSGSQQRASAAAAVAPRSLSAAGAMFSDTLRCSSGSTSPMSVNTTSAAGVSEWRVEGRGEGGLAVVPQREPRRVRHATAAALATRPRTCAQQGQRHACQAHARPQLQHPLALDFGPSKVAAPRVLRQRRQRRGSTASSSGSW